MSTGSILHNVVIDDPEKAEQFVDALENAEEISNGIFRTLIKCECGCSVLELELDGDKVFISHYCKSWNNKQYGYVKKILYRLKMCWLFLIGKEYLLYEVVMDKKHFDLWVKRYEKLGGEIDGSILR